MDATSSLWLSGSTTFNVTQSTTLISSSFKALSGKGNQGTTARRSRGMMHVVSPAPHAIHPICATVYRWLQQLIRHFAEGEDADEIWQSRWNKRDEAVLGPMAQIRAALVFLAIDGTDKNTWRCEGKSLDISVAAFSCPKQVRKLLHNARQFLVDVLIIAAARERSKDFDGLQNGWDCRTEVRQSTYSVILHRGGPSLLTGGIWTAAAMSLIASGPGNTREEVPAVCPRCHYGDETTMHRLWYCIANAPFLQRLKGTCSSTTVLEGLKPCTLRCGLFPAGSQFKLQDVHAIHEYLSAVNEHATDALHQSRIGNSLPSPNLENPRKLPRDALFDVAMPPLKRIKVAKDPQGSLPRGGQRNKDGEAEPPAPKIVEISPALAAFPLQSTYAFGTGISFRSTAPPTPGVAIKWLAGASPRACLGRVSSWTSLGQW